MAKKTVPELRTFVDKNMPSNSELLVKPFRTFFSYILDHLADIPNNENLTKLMQKVFATNDINSVNIQETFNNGTFQGNSVIEYLSYLTSLFNSIIPSKIIRMGNVFITDNRVVLTVHETGSNQFLIRNNLIEDTEQRVFRYTPVTFGIKILILYAEVPQGELETGETSFIHLAEGEESLEAVEPTVPEGSLHLKRIILNAESEIVEEVDQGFKFIEEDSWLAYKIPDNQVKLIPLGIKYAGSFELSTTIEGATIGGISSKYGKGFTDGRPMIWRNTSNKSIKLQPTTYADHPVAKTKTFGEEIILLPGTDTMTKILNGVIVKMKFGSPLEVDLTETTNL